MALPGVRTVLKDRFYTLSRTDAPEGISVAVIARRGEDNVGGTDGAPADYSPIRARGEKEVIDKFGEDSELHRAYLELTVAGAARVDLIPVPFDADYGDTAEGNPLEKAFENIEVVQSDIVVPWGRGGHPYEWDGDATPTTPPDLGLYANNSASTTTSFAKRVADHCKAISDRSNPIFAIMGIAPPDTGTKELDATTVRDHLETVSDLVDRDSMEDSGAFLSIVAGELKPTGYKTEWGYSNAAAAYAGLVASLDAEISGTGKLLFNVENMRYAPTRPLQETLIDQGLVPVALDYTRAAIAVDAQTFGPPTSDYTRLSTLRIVFNAVNLVRQACQRFIGMPATFEHRSSMETAITKQLRQMTVTGALLDSDFQVSYIPRENKAVIDLVLRPAFEIRNIEISISVDLGG